MSTNGVQLGNLTKLTREDQWSLWLEDLEDVIYLNKLRDYYDGTVQPPAGLGTEQQQAEFRDKHDLLRVLIHSSISPEIREKMRHHGYDRTKHRGKEIINFAEKSIKLISGNMDMLYANMWKDLRRADFASWGAFTAEFRRLYTKFRECGQEVTCKSACIHLFQKVKMYLPIWAEINEIRFLTEPDVDKLLLELESRGRQLEYEGVTLTNLKAYGDRNPRESVSDSKSKGAAKKNERTEENFDQKEDLSQGQTSGQ